MSSIRQLLCRGGCLSNRCLSICREYSPERDEVRQSYQPNIQIIMLSNLKRETKHTNLSFFIFPYPSLPSLFFHKQLIRYYDTSLELKVNSDYNYNQYFINMSTKLSDSSALQKYLLIGGGLAAFYFFAHYLAQRKPSSKAIPLETTQTLLKEIKYQVYASCIAFADGGVAKLRAQKSQQEVDIFLRTELAKVYDGKEDLILTKHFISRDEYAQALSKYSKNPQVAADQAEIIKVLEDSVKGTLDLTVHPAARQIFTHEQLLNTYRTMCEEIGIKVWEKLFDSKRNNPAFDPKNDQNFKAAIRELGIYEFKVAFLTKKGVRPEWGCPNLTFLKLLEGEKQKIPNLRLQATYVEKGYQNIISKVSNDPEAFDRIKIQRLMQDTITENRNKINPPPVNQAQPARQNNPIKPVQAPVPPPPQPKKPVVVAKPQDEDDDLEKMMMQELLSRSQEAPKVEEPPKVEQKPVPVPVAQPVVAEALAAPAVVEQEVKSEAVELLAESAPKEEIFESINVAVDEKPVVAEASDVNLALEVEFVIRKVDEVHNEVKVEEPVHHAEHVEVHNEVKVEEPVHHAEVAEHVEVHHEVPAEVPPQVAEAHHEHVEQHHEEHHEQRVEVHHAEIAHEHVQHEIHQIVHQEHSATVVHHEQKQPIEHHEHHEHHKHEHEHNQA